MIRIALHNPSLNNPQIQEYLEAACKGAECQVIIPAKGSWVVRTVHGENAPKIFHTKSAAVAFAGQQGGKLIFID